MAHQNISSGRPDRRYTNIGLLVLIVGLISADVAASSECPEENMEEVDHDGFFKHGLKVHWDAHHIGWASAGVATFIATSASLTNVYLHCKSYTKPLEQRQIIRILLMPTVYSVISFFAYRFYREYVYFAVIRDTYEGFVLAAFLILCLLYVGQSPLEQRVVMAQKEKSKLPFPFCHWRYRPSKPYFLEATKWSVLQYVIMRPLIALVAIITDLKGVLCASSYHYNFANLWLNLLTFLSATIALYGLLIIYHLAKEDLSGHRPRMKFLSLKIAVFLVFYQGFLLSFIDHLGLIRATQYWSRTNISDGINALITTIEMAVVAVVQLFAYPASEYAPVIKGSEIKTAETPFQNFLHSQDYRDFGRDIMGAFVTLYNKIRGRSNIQNGIRVGINDMDFQAAFGLGDGHQRAKKMGSGLSSARTDRDHSHDPRTTVIARFPPGSQHMESSEEFWGRTAAPTRSNPKVLSNEDICYDPVDLGEIDARMGNFKEEVSQSYPTKMGYNNSEEDGDSPSHDDEFVLELNPLANLRKNP